MKRVFVSMLLALALSVNSSAQLVVDSREAGNPNCRISTSPFPFL